MKMKIGFGFDAHRFKTGRQFILGGVRIPFDVGLEGHSDADVLVHAFMDGLLGAMGKGDIGQHFPDDDKQYRNISSMILLEKVMDLVEDNGYFVSNADITVLCQFPKLAPFVDTMEKNLAGACKISPKMINIKATTTEMMGFTGRREGIATYAAVLLMQKELA